MVVLLLAEVIGGELSVDATAKTIAATKSLGDITVLCAGAACGGAAEAAAKHLDKRVPFILCTSRPRILELDEFKLQSACRGEVDRH